MNSRKRPAPHSFLPSNAPIISDALRTARLEYCFVFCFHVIGQKGSLNPVKCIGYVGQKPLENALDLPIGESKGGSKPLKVLLFEPAFFAFQGQCHFLYVLWQQDFGIEKVIGWRQDPSKLFLDHREVFEVHIAVPDQEIEQRQFQKEQLVEHGIC